jgi:HEAT repeat protein
VPESVEFHAKRIMEADIYLGARKHIDALKGMKTPAAVKALASALEHENQAVVRNSAFALGEIALDKIRGKSAVQALIKALGHENIEVARNSAEVLGMVGDERALPYLMKHADHPNKYLRNAVKIAIRSIQEAKHVQR